MRLATFSGLGRAIVCAASVALPQVHTDNSDAKRGRGRHAFVSRVINIGRQAALAEASPDLRSVQPARLSHLRADQPRVAALALAAREDRDPRGLSNPPGPPSARPEQPVAGYIVRRLIQAIPILFGVAVISFALVYLAPGDPIDRFRTPTIRPEQLEGLIRQYGLDRPLPEQFWSWLTSYVQVWNEEAWGYSFLDGQPVLASAAYNAGGAVEMYLPA